MTVRQNNVHTDR